MTLASLSGSGVLWLPRMAGGTSTALPATRPGKTLDAVGEKYAIVFEISEFNDGKTIDKIGMRLHTVTASGNVDARIETVDAATGDPSRTLASTNSNKSQIVSATGWNQWSLTAGHTVSFGDLLAVVIEIPTASTAQIVTGEHRQIHVSGSGFPYESVDTGAGYVKSGIGDNIGDPSLSVGFSDGTWENIPGSTPVASIAKASLSSTGTPEAGLEFQIPFSARLSQVSFRHDCNGNPYDINLGNGSYVPGHTGANRLSTVSVDPDIMLFNSSPQMRAMKMGTAVTLSINTTYRVTVRATAAPVQNLYCIDVDSVGLLAAVPHGSTWKYIIDDGAGGWTTTTTRVPLANLGFSQFDDGAGGGGSSIFSPVGSSIVRPVAA